MCICQDIFQQTENCSYDVAGQDFMCVRILLVLKLLKHILSCESIGWIITKKNHSNERSARIHFCVGSNAANSLLNVYMELIWKKC